MSIKRSELKVTIAKLMVLAYSKDQGLTTQIMAQKGKAKLTVNQNGKVTLSGAAGSFTFSGAPVLENIGVAIRRIRVNFSNEGGMKVGYSATFTLEIISLTVSGSFDMEALITECSGFLCIAVRALKGRNKSLEMKIKKIMENR
ncbi:MAG: hypothetical protein COB30_016660 [Ectothiorhodospiraceae bacterium]|nr:hypothetical protein [Ectothiorhodospiraceae bacterium]